MGRIADALANHKAYIPVLSEYRGGDTAVRLHAALETLGYRYAPPLALPPDRSTELIAARCALRDDGNGAA